MIKINTDVTDKKIKIDNKWLSELKCYKLKSLGLDKRTTLVYE